MSKAPKKKKTNKPVFRYRLHEWGSIKTGVSSWGIQSQVAPGARFRHCCGVVRGVKRALIYTRRSRAESLIEALNRGEKPGMCAGLVPLKG